MGLFSKSSEATTGSQKTDTNRFSEGNYSRNPIIPEEWQTNYDQLGTERPTGGSAALDPYKTGMDAANTGLQRINETYNPYYANENSFTLNGMIDNYGYQAPQDVVAQKISADQVAARRGLDFSNDYENRFTDNVVNTTLDNYDIGTNRAANAFRANSIAGGQGGNARQSVASGVAAGEFARERAATEAGLRFGAQDRAFGLGMGDANRYLSADQGNQQANLNAAQYNAGMDMNAQQYNAGRLDRRQMFDANMAEQGSRRRMDAVNNMEQNLLAQAGINNMQANIGVNQANIDQNEFNQGLQYSDLGTKMFGEEGVSTENMTASEKKKYDELKLGAKASFPIPI